MSTPHHPPHDRVQRWLSLPQAPDAIWQAIGGYGAVADWHPEYVTCEVMEIAGETHRHMKHASGAYSIERLSASGPHFYASELVEGPLPVSDCRITLSVVEEPGGCHVFLSAHFEAEDPEADEIMAAIFEAGLEALGTRFGAA